jgi:hypothetical protein
MTTQSWSSRLRHDSDATFREWGLEFSTKLAAIGLVKTSDTGQIDWATVIRAGTNAVAGYEIWRMNDTQQATFPVYFKIEYGTLGTVSAPNIKIGIGVGSNGAGTLTGGTITRNINQGASQNADTGSQSYFCAVNGFVGFAWKTNSSGSSASFFVMRSNTAGVADGRCILVNWGGGSGSSITGRTAYIYSGGALVNTMPFTTNVQDAQLGFNPGAALVTAVGADIQCFPAWICTPRIEAQVGICGVLSNEVATGNTFTAAIVGAARTYICLPTVAGPFGPAAPNSASGSPQLAMLWE